MKKSSFILLACSLLLSCAAHADDPYLKLGVGWSRYDFGTLLGDKIANNETGLSIAYGAKYDKVWGLETGYVYFGSTRNGIEDANGNPSSFKAHALYLAGTGSMPLNAQVEAFGKLGLTVNHFRGPDDSATRTRMMAAIGGLWHVNKEWGASLEYGYFGKVDGLSLSQVTLSAVYNF